MYKIFASLLISISIIFLFMNCSNDDKDQLKFSIRAEIYDVLFQQDKIILTTDKGMFLYNLLTGKKEWHNKRTDGLVTLIFNDKLLSKSNNGSMCFLDIKTGKIIKEVEVGEFIHRIQIKDESSILFVQSNSDNYLLRCYNDATGDIVNLSTIDSPPRALEYFDNNIFLITERWSAVYGTNLFDGWLDVIDGSFYNTIAKYPVRFGGNHFVYSQGFLFFFNDKEELMKTDTNGNILESYPLPFDFASSRLIPNKEIILIRGDHGESFYAFDVKTETFIEIEKNTNGISYYFTVSNDDILYADMNSVYSYNIKSREKKNLYDLNGMELFNIFSNSEWFILILADNIRLALADDLPFTVLVKKMLKETR